MKKLFLILGMLIFGFYALTYIVMWMIFLIGSIFSENIYSNIEGFIFTLTGEGVDGFLVLTQVTILPILSGWLSMFLYNKFPKVNYKY